MYVISLWYRYQPDGPCTDLRKFIDGPSHYLTLPPDLKAAGGCHQLHRRAAAGRERLRGCKWFRTITIGNFARIMGDFSCFCLCVELCKSRCSIRFHHVCHHLHLFMFPFFFLYFLFLFLSASVKGRTGSMLPWWLIGSSSGSLWFVPPLGHWAFLLMPASMPHLLTPFPKSFLLKNTGTRCLVYGLLLWYKEHSNSFTQYLCC